MRLAFINWTHLMWFEKEQKYYALLKNDDPLEQCILYFWDTLNEDETLSKEFLEELMQMADDVKTGKVKTVPFTQDMFDRIEDLIGDTLETGTEDCLDCD